MCIVCVCVYMICFYSFSLCVCWFPQTSSPVEQLRALDDFPVVYERASELTQPKPKKKFHH